MCAADLFRNAAERRVANAHAAVGKLSALPRLRVFSASGWIASFSLRSRVLTLIRRLLRAENEHRANMVVRARVFRNFWGQARLVRWTLASLNSGGRLH